MIFILEPASYIDPSKFAYVYWMLKSIYGLWQAPHTLYEKFSLKLRDLHFIIS